MQEEPENKPEAWQARTQELLDQSLSVDEATSVKLRELRRRALTQPSRRVSARAAAVWIGAAAAGVTAMLMLPPPHSTAPAPNDASELAAMLENLEMLENMDMLIAIEELANEV